MEKHPARNPACSPGQHFFCLWKMRMCTHTRTMYTHTHNVHKHNCIHFARAQGQVVATEGRAWERKAVTTRTACIDGYINLASGGPHTPVMVGMLRIRVHFLKTTINKGRENICERSFLGKAGPPRKSHGVFRIKIHCPISCRGGRQPVSCILLFHL